MDNTNTNKKWNTAGILNTVGKDFIAGSMGGMSSIMAGHPFDTIKVMLQDASGNLPKFKNGYQALKYTIKVDGIKGIYRGLSVPLFSVSFTNSVFFATNNFCQNSFHPPCKDENGNDILIPYHKAAAAGAIAGGVISLLITPRDLIKSKLQTQGRPFGSTNLTQYKGPIDIIRKTIKKNGIKGMFKGIRSTFCRDIPGDAVYFVVYEFMKRKLIAIHNENNKKNGMVDKKSTLIGIPAWVAIGAGGCAGMSFWMSIYPMDVIKTRIQTQSDHLPPKYTGVLQTMKKIYKEEGISVFFRGFGATILRAFPTSAMNFMVYEATRNLLNSKENSTYNDDHYNAE